MNEDSLKAFGIAALLIAVGVAGLTLPPPWNPLRLKARYEKGVRPAVANATPRFLGIGFILIGLVIVAVGVVLMP